MPPEQQEKPVAKITTVHVVGFIHMMAHAHRAALLPFMRHSFGICAHEFHGIATIIGLLVLASAYPVFRLYFFLWLITMLGHRFQSFRLHFKGVESHSKFQGIPWLVMRWPGIKTEQQAKLAEPLFCLFAGMVLATISEPLGRFVMGGFISCIAIMAIDALVDWHVVRSMRDGDIEMRYYAEKYRE